ncbi:MAG: hypothetical protein IT349_15045 [Candidatus Eisenbacteria bacterium]|nr:hypothetical protein [Candidatus Eisenbacteria bacterium]MCC7143412.1 hypothetical protein [Candidatus Eisenbacteria bacterium]
MKKTSKRAAGGRGMTPERIKREAAIIADIKAGELSYRQIASKHEVSLPTVNNKARKAGISRGRREGAKIVLPAPRRGRPAGTTRAVMAARVAAARSARSGAPARRGRPARKAATASIVAAPITAIRRRRGRPSARARKAATVAARQIRSQAGFAEAFRQLVLAHHPNMTVSRFDKLMRMVQDAAE